MDNTKNDAYYLDRLTKDLQFITVQMKGIDIEELNKNEILLDSVLFRLIQISENSRKLTEETKACYEQVPWGAVYGLRNRIVHDYGNVDLNIVYTTLTEDIPELLELLQ